MRRFCDIRDEAGVKGWRREVGHIQWGAAFHEAAALREESQRVTILYACEPNARAMTEPQRLAFPKLTNRIGIKRP